MKKLIVTFVVAVLLLFAVPAVALAHCHDDNDSHENGRCH